MTLEKLRKDIYRIDSLLKKMEKSGPIERVRAKSLTDFKEKKKEYLLDQLNSAVESVKLNDEAIHEIESVIGRERASKLSRIMNGLMNGTKLRYDIESIADILGDLPEPKRREKLKLPIEIRDDVLDDLDEINRCMAAGCYRSVMILAGRVLETVLHRKYFELTGNDLLEKSPGIGLGKIIAKLRERNAALDPGLSEQIHLINQVRIHSVHKKRDNFKPTKEQAQAIVLYTIDVIKKI